jgi:hypothetical protein
MQQIKQRIALAVFAVFLLQPFANASAATIYHVSVDTSSLFGTAGYFDLQFNPGDVTSPSATATLSGFSGDVTLESGAVVDGGVSGALPGTIEFDNAAPFNAVLQPVTLRDAFDFTIRFSGAYETTASGSGTRFSLVLLDSSYEPLATVDPVGTILQFELMPGGGVAATTFDADAFGAESIVTLTAVPVPAALPLLASALVGFGFARRRAC